MCRVRRQHGARKARREGRRAAWVAVLGSGGGLGFLLAGQRSWEGQPKSPGQGTLLILHSTDATSSSPLPLQCDCSDCHQEMVQAVPVSWSLKLGWPWDLLRSIEHCGDVPGPSSGLRRHCPPLCPLLEPFSLETPPPMQV